LERIRAYDRTRRKTPKDYAAKKLYSRTRIAQWNALKAQAKKRGKELTITFEEFCFLREPGTCHYCKGQLPETGTGIDRKDSTKGYIPGNCVPCCQTCNTTKGHYLTHQEMSLIMAYREPWEEIEYDK